MTSYFSSLIKQSNKQLGTIVYLGAGSGGDIARLNELAPKHILAVEASTSLFAGLTRKTRKYKNIATKNQWVLPNEHQDVYLFNNPRYNSLCKPKLLEATYPNVKLQGQQDVKGMKLDTLVSEVDLTSNDYNVLILSIQGGEVSLLQGTKSTILNQFDCICIYTPENDLYEAQWNTSFKINDFILLPLLSDKNFPNYIYIRNEESIKFQKDLAQISQQHETLQNENQNLLKKNSEITKKSDEYVQKYNDTSAYNQKLSKEIEVLTNSVDKISAENKTLLENLQAQETNSKKLTESVSNLNAELQNSNSERQKVQQLFDDLLIKFNEKEKRLLAVSDERDQHKEYELKNRQWAEGLEESNTTLADTVTRLNKKIEALESDKNNLHKELQSTQQREQQISATLEINAKLLTKVQGDSEHLREQYREKVHSEEELKALVAQLHQKLQQAATFYHRLEKRYPELLLESTAL
jgi:hypothetical protein